MIYPAKLRWLLPVLFIWSCASTPEPAETGADLSLRVVVDTLELSSLELGTGIKASGGLLMELPPGLIRIQRAQNVQDSILIICIHGYRSEGYEWVTALLGLTQEYGASYFYRYDWDLCPTDAAREFNSHLSQFLNLFPAGRRLIIFSHSYGGLLAVYAASGMQPDMETVIHIIAAPLAGYPRLLDNCPELEYGSGDKLTYPRWSQEIRVIQHRTVHAQDGAFRGLAVDPQLVDLAFDGIDKLPPTMDGHRLGHNWSVTWVVDSFLGKAHRY